MVETVVNLITYWMHSDTALLWAFGAWAATFFAGEGGGILVLTIAHSELLNIPAIIICVFLGSLSADIFWYVVTTRIIRPWRKGTSDKEKVRKDTALILNLAKNHPYIVLLLIKFLIGLRLVLTIYISSRRDIPLIRYVLCNIVANILFVAVLFGTSVAINAHMQNIIGVTNTIPYFLTFIVTVSILWYLGLKVLQILLTKIFILKKTYYK